MTAIERKQNSEKILETLGIRLVDDLPPIEEEANVKLRTASEIAARILILSNLNCLVFDSGLGPGVIAFLKQEGLWESVSDEEKTLFGKTHFTDEEASVIQWRGEAIWLLLWVINKVDTLDLPVTEVNLPDVFQQLPGFMQNTADYINSATIRSLSEIMDQSDLILRLNWAIAKGPGDIVNEIGLRHDIAYERYYAINWVTGMRPQWDDEPNA